MAGGPRLSEENSDRADGMLPDVEAGTRVAGYMLERKIGAGGMAVVFRAVDERLGRRVALKVLAPALAADEAFRQRFIRESRAAAAVDDPHIIPVYEAGESDGVLYIAMRYVPGGDVGGLIRHGGPMPADRAAAIIAAIARALDSAHAAGLVHRDVKPANMLMDVRPGRADHVYLSDFGLSKPALSSLDLTGSGIFIGTLSYSSPEQIEGRTIDGRADQYSLACAAFEMLAGTPPFVRAQAAAIIWAHVSDPPPALSSLRSGLGHTADAVLIRALAKEPQRRFATCGEFSAALAAAIGAAPASVQAASKASSAPAPAAPAAAAASMTVPDEPTVERRRPAGLHGTAEPASAAAGPARRSRWKTGAAIGLAVAVAATLTAIAAGRLGAATAPVFGGTLKLAAGFGPDHLDPVPAYYPPDYVLERTYARQLVSYPSVSDPAVTSPGWSADTTPVADVAATVPTVSNGGITAGGRVYTFHLRSGVRWNTRPARQVTAADFVREFQAFCNPVSPVGNLFYYTEKIKGFGAYCSEESSYFAHARPTAAAIASFQNSHPIGGISALSRSTLRFSLTAPSADFLQTLALPFASARPAEYDRFVPGSERLNQHTISDGPYQISSYVPGRSLVLSRNPAWRQASDPIRHQFVGRIVVTMGVRDSHAVVAGERSGRYDLALETGLPGADIAALRSAGDLRFQLWPGSNIVPYLVFNLRSPAGAMAKLAVRRAIEFGVNKRAVQKVLGGAAAARILSTVIPPGNLGYRDVDQYPTAGGAGDPARCKQLLTQAGYPGGLTASYWYPDDSASVAIFHAIATSLAACGIRLTGRSEPVGRLFADLRDAQSNNKPGSFDIAQSVWYPDWFGNNGRAIIAPLFETGCDSDTVNYGCYSNQQMDALIGRAEIAQAASAAGALWSRADRLAMRDAVIVPVASQALPGYSSARVHQYCASACPAGVVITPTIGGPDLTNIWLSGG